MTTPKLIDDLSEEIYKRIKVLKEENIAQVLDFIAYLKSKETEDLGQNPLIEFITAEADPEMTLDTVREQLNSIKGNLADTVIECREGRI